MATSKAFMIIMCLVPFVCVSLQGCEKEWKEIEKGAEKAADETEKAANTVAKEAEPVANDVAAATEDAANTVADEVAPNDLLEQSARYAAAAIQQNDHIRASKSASTQPSHMVVDAAGKASAVYEARPSNFASDLMRHETSSTSKVHAPVTRHAPDR
eukprot:gb/GFBE01012761.1/.p1 GENE.gb/GFBE01012761.1/~~gb/GFBE01012761.1/.p1  ORF type:complete len:157 (+),score=25.69 gb/GFBE01012761.1/:1-471(+)